MINMSHCRFENTYNALLECIDHLSDREEMSEQERIYADKIAELFDEYKDELDTYEVNEWKEVYLGNEDITLKLTREIAHCCSHQGDCEADCQAWVKESVIADQLKGIDDDTLKAVLLEYFWDDTEHITNGTREDNLVRLLWIAAGEWIDKLEY